MPFFSVQISGTGQSLGSGIITNDELAERLNVEAEWIFSRTGINERRKAVKDEFASTMAAEAALRALADAALQPQDLDLIICASMFPEQPLPSTACLIQAAIGALRAAAFDVTAACSGFLFGLETACRFMSAGGYEKVLLVGVDLMTRFVDENDLDTSIIFADAAGAVVLERSDRDCGVLASQVGSDGRHAQLIHVKAGGTRLPASCRTIQQKMHCMEMRGREIFKLAVNKMSESCNEVLRTAGVSVSDLKMVIPHQANQRIINAVGERLEIPSEKMFSNIELIGNTGSASIAIALDDCRRKGLINSGDLVLFTAFGGGATWGSAVIKI
jgi:3-oxoacyl-[acyl-carrier-protein] synthase III